MSAFSTRGPGRPVDEGLWSRRREEILDAAAPLFAKHGFADMDTQVLAEALRVGKGTIYRYFPSKRELFLAAVDRVMQRLREYVTAAITDVEDPLEHVTRGIQAYLTFFAEHPEFVELLIQERAQFKDRTKPTYFEHRDASMGKWQELYRRLIADGRVRDVPVVWITDVVSDLLYGTMFTNYFTDKCCPVETQARKILAVVFHGILTEGERKRRPVDYINV